MDLYGVMHLQVKEHGRCQPATTSRGRSQELIPPTPQPSERSNLNLGLPDFKTVKHHISSLKPFGLCYFVTATLASE